MKLRMFRKHGSWFCLEEVPGAGVNGAGGEGTVIIPGGDKTPPDPPAGGEIPEKTVPLSRLNEVIGERNDGRRQIEALTENLSTVLARVDELAGLGKSKTEIAEIISTEAKEWSDSKGFNEAVQLAVRGEMKRLDGKIGGSLQMQARVILDNFKKDHPDLDEKNPEFVKRIQAGYTLEDAHAVVFGKKTLGKPGEVDEPKPKLPHAPPYKPGPQEDKLKTPKTPISLKESFRKALKSLGLQEGGSFPKE